MQNKRGESLVEVIIALGIIAFIFVGAANIIASSITLNTSSRQRTESVAMVQKKLNEYLAQNTNSGVCTVIGRTTATIVSGTLEGDAGCNIVGALSSNTSTCYWIELSGLDTDAETPETYSGLGLENNRFIKVVSHGKWYTRILGEQSFEISRIIRNN